MQTLNESSPSYYLKVAIKLYLPDAPAFKLIRLC